MSSTNIISQESTAPDATLQPVEQRRTFDLHLINPTEYSEYDAATRPVDDIDWTDLLRIVIPLKLTEWARNGNELLTGLYTAYVSQDSLSLIHPDCLEEGHQYSDEVKEAFARGVWKGEYEVSRFEKGDAIVSFISCSNLKVATDGDKRTLDVDDETEAIKTP